MPNDDDIITLRRLLSQQTSVVELSDERRMRVLMLLLDAIRRNKIQLRV